MKAHLYARRTSHNAAQTAKLLLVQINSKTQVSQLEMCILTYRRHWRMRRVPLALRASWPRMRAHRIGNDLLGACARLTYAELAANGVVQ